MKGQQMVILTWIFGMITIFMVILVYYTMYPVVSTDIGGLIINESADTSIASEIESQINLTRIAVPVALLVLVVGVLLYLWLASQKEDPEPDIW